MERKKSVKYIARYQAKKLKSVWETKNESLGSKLEFNLKIKKKKLF